MTQKKKILHDHKRQGKTFVPPLGYMIGPFQEVSWTKTMLPELLWIALIHEHLGYRDGVALITTLSRLALECAPSKKKRVFATTSSLAVLTQEERILLQAKLAHEGQLFPIQKALAPLLVFYPECPLRFLYTSEPELIGASAQNLDRLKNLLAGLYDKMSKGAMMIQASAIWLAFDSGALKVFQGLALADFPEIEKYPLTGLSKRVAGGIRASVFMFFREPFYPLSADWPRYFWNRGFEIDDCYFERMSNE